MNSSKSSLTYQWRHSIAGKVYLGFAILITVMLISAWLSITTNNNVSNKLVMIERDSAPVLQYSSELTINFLNINRRLTPYLNVDYIDELPPHKTEIDKALAQYFETLAWFEKRAEKDSELAIFVNDIVANNQQAFRHLQQVMTQYEHYLDGKDVVQDKQSQFSMTGSQLANQLNQRVNQAGSTQVKQAIEQFASQVSLIESELNKAFMMADSFEVKAVERQMRQRKERFEDAGQALDNLAPDLYSNVETTVSIFSQQVFSKDSVLAISRQQIESAEAMSELNLELEAVIDVQLVAIRALSDYAQAMAQSLYQDSYAQAEQAKIMLVTIVVASTVLAILIGLMIAQSIRKPSKLVNNTLDKVSNKDLSSKVMYSKRNEFGLLSSKVNLVIEHLAEMINQINRSSFELNHASLENQHTSEELKAAIQQQANETIQVATAMEQIECSVTEIANSSSSSLSLVNDAVAKSTNGQSQMKQSIELIQKLSEHLSGATGLIEQVDQESRSIESILDVISSISEQTNLLALNAAIEAARAGEHGRGFSVVADEVRVLAAKTTQSTREIQLKIEQLQGRSGDAVAKVGECVGYMTKYVKQSDGVHMELVEVHQLLNEIEQQSHLIASSTGQHQLAATEVTKNISRIHELADANANLANALASHGEKLETMAQHQQSLTDSFVTDAVKTA